MQRHQAPLPLTFKAGPAARKFIAVHGVTPNTLSALAGAAGGPKWLVLAGIDKWLFGEWLQGRSRPLPAVGSSIGSWRFAAAAQPDAVKAIESLERLYIEQAFSARPDRQEITDMGVFILDELLGPHGGEHALKHPWLRLHIVTAYCQHLTASDHPLALTAGFTLASLSNLLGRKHLGRHLHRHVYADPREPLPSCAFPHFNQQTLALTNSNIAHALLASGSIPYVLNAITIDGKAGYRDGGLIDYHIDLPLVNEGLVFMPHFSRRLVTGWLDKTLAWRRPHFLDNHLVIHPSDAWIASLPNKKIPDRSDFKRYKNNYQQRVQVWREVTERSQELADCLAERAVRQDWLAHIEPL